MKCLSVYCCLSKLSTICCGIIKDVLYVVYILIVIHDTAQGIEGYVLVAFKDEGTTAVVPGRKIECNNMELKKGEEVNVTWSDGKQYLGTVITSGMLLLRCIGL